MHKSRPEPWLRGTHSEITAVPRAVIHAVELAQEDLITWCRELTEQEISATPFGLPSIASQIRHIARSMDRLLTYADGAQLNAEQLEALNTENNANGAHAEPLEELSAAFSSSLVRVRKLGENSAALQEPRAVGRQKLPTTLAGLLVHVADHTQRHVGQAITTAKLVRAQRA